MSKKTVQTKIKNGSGLREKCLSFTEVLAQSIANIAPSATPALVIPLVFATAGNGTWLAYLFATVAVVLVGISLNHFTKRSASPGSLYAYVVKGLGPNVGVITGWALVLAYLLTASAVLCGFVNYANVLLQYGGLAVPPVIIGIIGAAVAWYVAFKDIKLSTQLMLTFEVVSLALIFILAIDVLAKHDFQIDYAQLTLQGVSPADLRIGLVLAFFSFVGFESAASLGAEARNPLRTIPKAVTASAIFVGIFFVILSYTEVLGFNGIAVKLNEAEAPLTLLADENGIEFFGPLISIGALISFWACFLASINAGARILFLMGQHGVLHSSVGSAHTDNKTPHIAVTITTILAAIVPLILIAFHNSLFDIYGWVGTIATYGFLLSYALIAIAAPFYLYREKELHAKDVVLAALAFLILLIPIVGSVYPFPPSPYLFFPFIFAGWLVIGGLWFFIRKSQLKNVVDGIDIIHQRFREIRAGGDGEGI